MTAERRELRLVPFSFWLGRGRLAGGEVPVPDRDPASGPAGRSGPDAGPSQIPSDQAPDGACDAGWHPASNGGRVPTLARLQQAMADQLTAQGHPAAEPLRWAITGVDPERGLRLEGIGLSHTASWADAAGESPGNPEPGPQGAGSGATPERA